MLLAFVVGISVGFVLSMPPGPIAVAVMRQAFDGRPKAGVAIGLGAASMDILYSLIAIFASSAIVVSLKDVITGNLWLLLLLQTAAVVTLIILGFRYLKPSPKNVADTAKKEQLQEDKARKMGASQPYGIGIMMSIVNLPSPTFLPSLIGIASYLHANDWVDDSFGECMLYAVGFGVGAALWFTSLMRVLYSMRERISPSFVGTIYKITGASFLLFALLLLYNVITSTEWSQLV